MYMRVPLLLLLRVLLQHSVRDAPELSPTLTYVREMKAGTGEEGLDWGTRLV